jgi:hypothetical protein
MEYGGSVIIVPYGDDSLQTVTLKARNRGIVVSRCKDAPLDQNDSTLFFEHMVKCVNILASRSRYLI